MIISPKGTPEAPEGTKVRLRPGILDAAKEHDARLVVLGSSSRTNLPRAEANAGADQG